MSRLLIVDDSDDLLELMKYFFEKNGYVIETLNQPHDIQNVISKFHPDLLILDVFLPGNDGRKICKQLKEMHENKHLLILVFSASPRSLEDYEAYYADDFIEKPFELKDLDKKIKAILKWRDSGDDLNYTSPRLNRLDG